MDFLKAEQIGSAKWRVLAIPFGGEFKGGKDSDREFFSVRTDIKPTWFNERPALFHHGKDAGVGDDSIGIEDELELDPKLGWWAKLWLDRSHRYHAAVDSLLRAGKMYGSSGPLSHLVKIGRDGEILVWPHIEQTLTPTPANRLSRIEPIKAFADFTSAGIDTEALKALVDAADIPDLEGPTADLRDDLSPDGGSGDPGDLSGDGGSEAIQRLPGDPKRERAKRQLADLAPRLGQLTNG